MARNSISFPVRVVEILLVVGLLSAGPVVCTQAAETGGGVNETPVTSQALPNDPGRSSTAVVVELAPGAKAAGHQHAGIVFADGSRVRFDRSLTTAK